MVDAKAFAIVSKTPKLTRLTCEQNAKLVFSIRENKFGVSILNLVKTIPKSSVKQLADGLTVIALKLNNTRAVNMRKLWVSVGWFLPKDFIV